MAEYIDIGQLWKCETCYHSGPYGCVLDLECDYGENYRPSFGKLKKADVAPVVHGRWVEIERSMLGSITYQCSACEHPMPFYNGYPHCPYCGSKMDLE